MNNYQISILLMLSVLTLSGCSRTEKEYFPDGSLKSEINLRNGKYHGEARYYYENGSPMMTCSYRNGQLDGTLMRYFQSGFRKEQQTYRDGKLNGPARVWDRFSHLIQEMNYANGKPEGTFQEWYPNRILKVDGRFRDGMFDGVWLYYDEFGKVTGQGEFVKGTGKQKVYSRNGNLIHITHYKNNVKDGEEVFMDEQGKITQTIIYKNGQSVNAPPSDTLKKNIRP